MHSDDETIQFWVHIDLDTYEDIETLLASHAEYSDDDGRNLRAIIRLVARKLKMGIPISGKRSK